MKKSIYHNIFSTLARYNPTPTTELEYENNFQLLISVILSAQATDISVNKATSTLYKTVKKPEDILSLGEELLKNQIKTIGLFNTKAKNIIKTCEILVNTYESGVPKTREALEKLPRVGRKTANVILNTAFNKPFIAVDTHIFRVSNRTGMAKGKTVMEVEATLTKKTPKEFIINAHHWLILHGRYTCTARKPNCHSCCINNYCSWPNKNNY